MTDDNNPVASIYIQLSHPQYKSLETQLRAWEERETAHTSEEGYYHKSIAFIAAGVRWEFHGPIVKAAEPEAGNVESFIRDVQHVAADLAYKAPEQAAGMMEAWRLRLLEGLAKVQEPEA